MELRKKDKIAKLTKLRDQVTLRRKERERVSERVSEKEKRKGNGHIFYVSVSVCYGVDRNI